MLNNQDRCPFCLLSLIDQSDRALSRRRVQIGKRLVKQQDIHITDQHARHGYALLLSTRQCSWCMIEQVFYIHSVRRFVHAPAHLVIFHSVILQRKCDILRHRKPDELTVRVLQNRTHRLRQSKNTQLCGILALNAVSPRDVSGIGKRHKPVDAVRQCRLSGTGRSDNQNLLPRINGEIDVL